MKHLLAFALALLAAFGARADDAAERERIRAERTAVGARFAEAQKACRAKFAVTDCEHKAQRVRNAALADLRRQELVVNETERRRRAAELQKELDDRTSPATRGRAEERARLAAQEQKDRQARAEERAQKRAEDEARRAAQPPRGPRASAAHGPQGTPRDPQSPRSHGPTPAEAAKHRADSEQRLRAAESHNAKVRARIAARRKPAASDLPLPP